MTEKYFKVLPYNVIPIVLNGANMSKLAPPHSYINVQDFTSTQHLAEYLNLINNNATLFASYFWWRDHFKVQVLKSKSSRGYLNNPSLNQAKGYARKQSWCKLCELLHKSNGTSYQLDLKNVLNTVNNCKNPPYFQQKKLPFNFWG